MNRAQAYGDGLFETMRVSGGRLLHPEEHYFRLMASMRILRMQIPLGWNPEGWLDALGIAELNPIRDYRIRLSVWRNGGLGYAYDPNESVSWSVDVHELDSVGYPQPVLRPELGIFQDHRKQAGLLANVKSTSSLLYVLAAGFAREQRVDDVLLMNAQNEVLESSRSNVMLLQGDVLRTPPLASGALRGVMREVVLGLAPALGLRVHEEVFSPFALQQADEVWLTNTINGVAAVRQFRKTSFGHEVATAMQKLVQDRAEVAQFQ